MKAFFDTSALIKRYIREDGSDAVIDICASTTELVLSAIAVPEVVSCFSRLKRQRVLTESQFDTILKAFYHDIRDISFCQISQAVIINSVKLLQSYQLRTLDTLQLACAQSREIDVFVSADVRQLAAGAEMGFQLKAVA